MALQKTFTLTSPAGVSGNYILLEYERKHAEREAYASLLLYASQAGREANPTPIRRIAKFWLRAAQYDAYLSTAVLAGVTADDPVRAQLYAAAKAGSSAGVEIISDWGPDPFADAEDV